MTSGFDELSLALFTALTPAGVVAFICVAALILLADLDRPLATKANRLLALPFAVALIGFIASATHLGTPANALHVFSGIGRSPLSNEVLAALTFLFLGGSYWMMAFKEDFPKILAKGWLTAACLAGVAFIVVTSLAYGVNTVPTWDSPFTPVNLILSALFAGPILALFTGLFITYTPDPYRRILLGISGLALVVGSIVLLMHNASLEGIANNEMIASVLAPNYFAVILIHVGLGVIGLACSLISTKATLPWVGKMLFGLAACTSTFLAIFLVRLVFYSLHMTVGF